MYRIRNFGNDRQCHSLADLEQTLTRDYQGKSVSIEYPRPSGILGIAFVDVTVEGEIQASYGGRERFNLAQIAA